MPDGYMTNDETATPQADEIADLRRQLTGAQNAIRRYSEANDEAGRQLVERDAEIKQLNGSLDAARRQREAWKRQCSAERKHSKSQDILIAGLRGKMT